MLARGPLGVLLVLAAAAVCVLAWTLPACGPARGKDYRALLLETGKPALHAIHSQRLADVMRHLDDLALERLPQELDPHTERERQMDEIEEIAVSLARTCEHIADALSENDMSAADHELYLILASRLGDQAGQLGDCAAEREVVRVEEAMEQMTATCNACHSLFREVPPLKG